MSIDHVCRCESVFDHPSVLDDLKCLTDIFYSGGLLYKLKRCTIVHAQHNISTAIHLDR